MHIEVRQNAINQKLLIQVQILIIIFSKNLIPTYLYLLIIYFIISKKIFIQRFDLCFAKLIMHILFKYDFNYDV